MELASPELLAELLARTVRVRPARRGSGLSEAGQFKGGSGSHRRPRCRCGRCQQCLDDARWERIFAEKFADPDYYCRPTVRTVSPLTSL